ncbi:MAG: hypothetical protein SPF60_11220 [Lachnospiraceae bacterium]|nr:hypothetical protein [Lachnospiraceae bacterium]
MNARQKLHQLHLQEWTARFAEQKASGLTVRQWFDQNNYSIHTYNYWKHILKEQVADQLLPDIVPLSLPEALPSCSDNSVPVHTDLTNRTIRANCSTVNLTVNDIVIEVSIDTPEDFLCRLIKAVRYA